MRRSAPSGCGAGGCGRAGWGRSKRMTGLLGESEPSVRKGPAWIALALTLVACGSSAQPADLPRPAAVAPPTEVDAAVLPTATTVAVSPAPPGIVGLPTAAAV